MVWVSVWDQNQQSQIQSKDNSSGGYTNTGVSTVVGGVYMPPVVAAVVAVLFGGGR